MNARPHDDTADRCAIDFVVGRFTASNGDLRELVVAVAASDSFLYRRVPERGQ
jgi:hypothetical protein